MAMALASVSAPRDKTSVAIARVQGAQLLSVVVGPAVGGIVASHLGIRPAFYVTAAMCVVALIALIFLFQETGPLQRGAGRIPARSVPLAEFLRYPLHLVICSCSSRRSSTARCRCSSPCTGPTCRASKPPRPRA
jgi:DHA1 family multidrug resistance protein-like MFS transporter